MYDLNPCKTHADIILGLIGLISGRIGKVHQCMYDPLEKVNEFYIQEGDLDTLDKIEQKVHDFELDDKTPKKKRKYCGPKRLAATFCIGSYLVCSGIIEIAQYGLSFIL